MYPFVLETEGIYRSFPVSGGVLEVLKGIDLQISSGEFVSITGASGVGKSTLLHILGGLDLPTSGVVKACGEMIKDYNDGHLSRYRNKRVGFVFQFHYLLDELSAAENAMLPLLIRGERRNKASMAALKALEEVELADRASHKPAQLSGGECQRAALARALVGTPEILIADEPTGDLDGITARKLHDLLIRLNKDKKMTIIIATHDLSLARLATRKMELAAGKLVEAGS